MDCEGDQECDRWENCWNNKHRCELCPRLKVLKSLIINPPHSYSDQQEEAAEQTKNHQKKIEAPHA